MASSSMHSGCFLFFVMLKDYAHRLGYISAYFQFLGRRSVVYCVRGHDGEGKQHVDVYCDVNVDEDKSAWRKWIRL